MPDKCSGNNTRKHGRVRIAYLLGIGSCKLVRSAYPTGLNLILPDKYCRHISGNKMMGVFCCL
jgi:hypothetical protein